MGKKIVMVFGTFDIFHKGHIDFLKQAKKIGDYLLVVIARDKTVSEVKGNYPLNTENKRKKAVVESKLADRVVLGKIIDKYWLIRKFKPDFIALGYDQKFFIDKLKNELEKDGLVDTKIIKLKSYHPEIYKSSKIKLNKNF